MKIGACTIFINFSSASEDRVIYSEDKMKEISGLIDLNIVRLKTTISKYQASMDTSISKNEHSTILPLNDIDLYKKRLAQLEKSKEIIGYRKATLPTSEINTPKINYYNKVIDKISNNFNEIEIINERRVYQGTFMVTVDSNGQCRKVSIIRSTENLKIDKKIEEFIFGICPFDAFDKALYAEYDFLDIIKSFEINSIHHGNFSKTKGSSLPTQ